MYLGYRCPIMITMKHLLFIYYMIQLLHLRIKIELFSENNIILPKAHNDLLQGLIYNNKRVDVDL